MRPDTSSEKHDLAEQLRHGAAGVGKGAADRGEIIGRVAEDFLVIELGDRIDETAIIGGQRVDIGIAADAACERAFAQRPAIIAAGVADVDLFQL
jgi:hypothetical protein